MKNAHLLIVEEDRHALDALISALGPRYDISPAPDPQQALRNLLNQSFDLLITDVHMSGPDGFELVRLAQQQDPDLPALFVGADDDVALSQKLLSMPGTFRLNRPWQHSLPLLVERALEFGALRRSQRNQTPAIQPGSTTQRMALLGFRAMGMTHDIRESVLNVQVNLEDVSETLQLAAELLSRSRPGRPLDPQTQAELVTLLRSSAGTGALNEAIMKTAVVAEVVSATWAMLRGTQEIPGLCDIRQAIVRAHDDTLVLFTQSVEVQIQGMPMARIDESQLVRALTNILANAARAARGKRSVSVHARELRGEVIIDVDDDGAGFPQEVVRALDNNSMEPLPAQFGPGFGLTISRDLLRSAGGDLQVFRLDEGGSRVRVRIPGTGGGSA